jgi:hypothetical protein
VTSPNALYAVLRSQARRVTTSSRRVPDGTPRTAPIEVLHLDGGCVEISHQGLISLQPDPTGSTAWVVAHLAGLL